MHSRAVAVGCWVVGALWLTGCAFGAAEFQTTSDANGKGAGARSSESFDLSCATPPAGRVAARRLTNDEYANTVRALLFLPSTVDPAKDFAPDVSSLENFSNDSTLLDVSPDRAQGFMTAAVAMSQAAMTQSKASWLTCNLSTGGRNCAKDTLSKLAMRAYRRPVTTEEVDALMRVYDANASSGADTALQRSVQAILVSGRFLFLTVGVSDGVTTGVHTLNSYETASRLSYLLWQSMPDQTLFDAAAAHELSTAAQLRAQIERMLNDPRAALTKGFARGWLGLNAVATTNVDATLFPGFSAEVRRDLTLETERFVDTVISERRPVRELFSADYSFMNARVAAHYGRSGVTGETFQKVSLGSDTSRRGVLAHASVLNVSAGSPIRTSPTIRGHWVLEKVLCKAPPPPPGGIPTLGSTPGTSEGTLKERLAAHRTQPSCAGCHQLMDPIGLGLENFDVVGKWRSQYADGSAVDPTGQFPDGTVVSSAGSVLEFLANSDETQSCVAEKLMAFALNREVTDDDACTAQAIGKVSAEAGRSIVDVVLGIALTRQFQQNEQEGESL